MKIACITAIAAGMYCGHSLLNSMMIAALCRQRHEASLIPTCTQPHRCGRTPHPRGGVADIPGTGALARGKSLLQ
jgi:hypothetical protein